MSYNFGMQKRLYRSRTEAVLGGVCGGLAQYFGGDPVLWRLGTLLLMLVTAVVPVVVVYLITWVIVPLEPRVDYTVVS